MLKGKYRRRGEKNSKNTEPVWINDVIRKEIKERRRRNATTNEEERERWKELYPKQKERVHVLIKKEICKQEEKTVKEMKESKDGGKKMWEYIKKLKGEKIKEKNPLKIYGEDGVQLEQEKVAGGGGKEIVEQHI